MSICEKNKGANVSNSEMSDFFAEQVEHIHFQIRCEIPSFDGGRIRRRLTKQAMAGQARVYAETYSCTSQAETRGERRSVEK